MEIKKSIRKFEWFVPIVLIVGSFFGGSYYGQWRMSANLESKCDTVTKIVPVYKDFPQPQKTAKMGYVSVPAYKFLTDTIKSVEWAEIAVHDTTVVYLPKQQKFYNEEDGKLRIWVSGYEPSLDRYELDKTEMTITQTITPKLKRWSLGVTVGYGLTLQEKATPSPFLGIGVTYSFFSF